MGEMRHFMTFPARETLATAAERRLNWAAFARNGFSSTAGRGAGRMRTNGITDVEETITLSDGDYRRRERRS
jgi:hypothetical protein